MNISNRLFWDVDVETLDFSKNARFIIQRVIQRGTLEDWVAIKDYYGIDFIRKEITQMRSLDMKTFNFFSTYFELPKKEFKCFSTKQSNRGHFNY